jgi:hypothetical protein
MILLYTDGIKKSVAKQSFRHRQIIIFKHA